MIFRVLFFGWFVFTVLLETEAIMDVNTEECRQPLLQTEAMKSTIHAFLYNWKNYITRSKFLKNKKH